MSSDERSREALSPDENKALLGSFIRTNAEDFTEWCKVPENMAKIETADEVTKEAFDKKSIKWSVPAGQAGTADIGQAETGMTGILESKKAPAVISEQTPSERPKPTESDDVEVLSWSEHQAGGPVGTLDYIHVPVNPGDPHDCFIDQVIRRNEKTGKLIVAKRPAKKVKILPEWVLRFRGSVVKDFNAVHSNFVTYKGKRNGYSFDRFFVHNGKKLSRCCLVQDRVHQAGLLYEKFVPKNAPKGIIRLRVIPGTQNESMYELVKKTDVSGDYRDLKTLFIRHFLTKNDGIPQGDPALEKLINEAYSEVSTEL